MSTSTISYETAKIDSSSESRSFVNQFSKPLVCFVCDDYYNSPCLLSCYHTFCSRCVEGRANNAKIVCPICSCETEYKGPKLSPDPLIQKLIDITNAENPPCSNCDKRNKISMFFCSTCGQALCNECRENIHKAKMFSSHEIMPISKFSQDGLRKCNIHNEPYIVYSVSQSSLLCRICLHDIPREARQKCLDIDTAYSQTVSNLESIIMASCEAQNAVREGIVLYRSQLDELHRNTDNEKMAIRSFAQGMQDAISSTQTIILTDIQREYEQLERSFQGQLGNLSAILSVIQQHIALCQHFTNSLNKYQFLEVVFAMIERLSTISKLPPPFRPLFSSQLRTGYRSEFSRCLEPWFGKSLHNSREIIYESAHSDQPCVHGIAPSHKQQSALRMKALEGDGPFSIHYRSFNSQFKELSMQMKNVHDRLMDLQKDISLVNRTTAFPVLMRYRSINHDCARIFDTLGNNQAELDRLKSVFQSIWQEQLCRIRVEQDIFQSQINDITKLKGDVKQLISMTQNIESCISQFSSCNDNAEMFQTGSMVRHISQMRSFRDQKSIKSVQQDYKEICAEAFSPTRPVQYFPQEEIKSELPLKDDKDRSLPETKSRGMLSQLMDKVRKTPMERSKSEDRVREIVELKDTSHCGNSPNDNPSRLKSKRVSNLYHSFGAYRNRSKSTTSELQVRALKSEEPCYSQMCGRVHPEVLSQEYIQISEKTSVDVHPLEISKWKSSRKGNTVLPDKESDYQTIAETKSNNLKPNPNPAVNKNSYSSDDEDEENTNYSCTTQRMPKKRTPSPPTTRRTRRRRYPHSDTEETLRSKFRRSLSGASDRRGGGTCIVLIDAAKSGGRKQILKQRSWETFPPKKKPIRKSNPNPTFCYNPETFNSHFDIASIEGEKIKKSDSFEGHEEAVSSLVREFQKIRMIEKQQKHRMKTV